MAILGRIGRAFRSVIAMPLLLVPWREIKTSGREIDAQVRSLWERKNRASMELREAICDTDRAIDFRGFTEARGLTDGQAQALVRRRRRETARAAYLCFFLGWAAFLGLLYRVSTASWTSAAVVTALEFSPFCLVFFLMAFQFALQNFRLRTLRHATVVEFLNTNAPFWPR
jgi:hypothetical protein